MGPMVQAAPLVVTAMVATHQQDVEASRQAAVWQVAAVAPWSAIEEASPLRPPTKANRRVSFSMTTRYHLTRMSLCTSGCGNFPVPGLLRSMRQSRRRPRLTRRLQQRGPR
jgi:Tfp pilus assembly protein PilV